MGGLRPITHATNGPTRITTTPMAANVVRHPNSLTDHTIGGTSSPAMLLPPITIAIAVARRLVAHALTEVMDGVKPPTLNPTDSTKNAA